MLDALMAEMSIRKNYLDSPVESIYFGGGTPSLLDASEISRLIDQIHQHFEVSNTLEITLEANPDDLNGPKVAELKQTPVNRFSIGVQSFFDEDLQWMNRSHNAGEAESAIKRVQDAGFENITADLIYGFPLLSDSKWRANIQQMLSLAVAHVSCYGITVEPGTALHHFIKKGKNKGIDEQQGAAQLIMLIENLELAGFEHYEISNFAKPGYQSKHNSNYWKGETYLGIGPSAHSFNGHSRQWNVSNNMAYLQAIAQKEIPATIEKLSLNNRFNEYVMTSLRTAWGTDMNYIKVQFGEDQALQLLNKAETLNQNNWLSFKDDKIFLTREGKLFADHIASEFFIIDDE